MIKRSGFVPFFRIILTQTVMTVSNVDTEHKWSQKPTFIVFYEDK
jgi:hypothetical protein